MTSISAAVAALELPAHIVAIWPAVWVVLVVEFIANRLVQFTISALFSALLIGVFVNWRR